MENAVLLAHARIWFSRYYNIYYVVAFEEYAEDFTHSTCKEIVVYDEKIDCRFKTKELNPTRNLRG